MSPVVTCGGATPRRKNRKASVTIKLESFERTWQLLGRVPAPEPDGEAMHERFARVLTSFESGGNHGFGGTTAGGMHGRFARHSLVAAAAAASCSESAD